MSQTKTLRPAKRQLGQFLTPSPIARRLLSEFVFTPDDTVLEPSFGDGAFLLPLIEAFIGLHDGPLAERLARVLTENVWGVEIDPVLHGRALAAIAERWGALPERHNLQNADFFRADLPEGFSYVVGNPPFGGTIAPELQDALDKSLGWRGGLKIKKETYSFFIVKAMDLLKPGGRLRFICSDTFLTINTMQGLRRHLLDTGAPGVTRLGEFSDETQYAMVVLDWVKTGRAEAATVEGRTVERAQIAATGNHSWQVTDEYAPYFTGPTLGDFVVATSGMTVGANALFVRPIRGNAVTEPYTFEFFDEALTLAREVERARLGVLPPAKRAEIAARVCRGETRRNVRVMPRDAPVTIPLPHTDYRPYNKASSALVYAPPTHAIYWKDDGDAVLTFKKSGPWYLHGVGGQKYFGREGLTWQLISDTLNVRWLPPGYILDSGAPCAFLREGVAEDELFFILGWALSPLCGRLLKDVINHTKNIQGKDFERLPYPFWVDAAAKREMIARVHGMVAEARAGRVIGRGDRAVTEVGAGYGTHPAGKPATHPC